MKILAIDTSCDDTSVAISEGRRILSNIFWSKMDVHSKWGGVMPSEAKRQHEEFLQPAINSALGQAQVSIDDIDYFAVTYGPGLAIALEPGIDKAKELSMKYAKPLIPVNHMVAHIYANLALDIEEKPLSQFVDFEFPALALTISGGHTDLYKMDSHLHFNHIGWTLDDAIGEAFDKVGRLLGMGFPAGYKIEQIAKNGDDSRFSLPRPLFNSNDFNWSYSGLKTAVLYELSKLTGDYGKDQEKGRVKLEDISAKLSSKDIADMSASFQKAATESLIHKLYKALENKYSEDTSYKMLIIGGGVIANSYIREALEKLSAEFDLKLVFPTPMWLCTDNAAMIATTAYYYLQKGIFINPNELSNLDRKPSLTIAEDEYLNFQ